MTISLLKTLSHFVRLTVIQILDLSGLGTQPYYMVLSPWSLGPGPHDLITFLAFLQI